MTEHEFYTLGYASMQTLQTEEATFLTLLFGSLLQSMASLERNLVLV